MIDEREDFMRKHLTSLLLAGLALVAGASQLSAATVQVTYRGTVSSGIDVTGEFGTMGADLLGLSSTAVYLFDTTRGHTDSSSTHSSVSGGSFSGIDSPALSAVLRINGYSVEFGGDYFGVIQATNDGSTSSQYHDAQSFEN